MYQRKEIAPDPAGLRSHHSLHGIGGDGRVDRVTAGVVHLHGRLSREVVRRDRNISVPAHHDFHSLEPTRRDGRVIGCGPPQPQLRLQQEKT